MAKKELSPLTKKFLLAAKREGLCSRQNEPALMDKLADLVEDCIEQNGIETYEELIEAFGTPQKVVVEQLEFIDEKGLRARARQKHRTRNVVLYLVFLVAVAATTILVLMFSMLDDYERGIKAKLVYDYEYTHSLFDEGVTPEDFVITSSYLEEIKGVYIP